MNFHCIMNKCRETKVFRLILMYYQASCIQFIMDVVLVNIYDNTALLPQQPGDLRGGPCNIKQLINMKYIQFSFPFNSNFLKIWSTLGLLTVQIFYRTIFNK